MTARSEKPAPHESSTDTIIGALEIVANIIESQDDVSSSFYALTVREAAQRLDKLERELENARGAAKAEFRRKK